MKLLKNSINNLTSRRAAAIGLAALVALGATLPLMAQDYPNKPIKLVVPYPPGGATDVIGRVMAQKLSTALNQQVIVDNRVGATGSFGAAFVAAAPPDGYTLLMGAMTSHSISAVLNPKVATFSMEKSCAGGDGWHGAAGVRRQSGHQGEHAG